VTYEERTPPETPPCSTCRVELLPQNRDAAEVYLMSRGQIITRGMDGMIVDVDNTAIDAAMRAKRVQDAWDCLIKVRHLFHAVDVHRE